MDKKLTLERLREDEHGTHGVLKDGDTVLCHTLEEPWKSNQPRISCVPVGTYKAVPHSGPRFKDVWLLQNVPGREAILIHAGNTLKDTEGCILVGLRPTDVGVADSRAALQFLRQTLPSHFEVEITCKNG